MAKHSRLWNRNIYDEYLRQGKGQGAGSDYEAWIRIQDFASKGVVSRIKGRKTGRVHQLMSNNELAYFYHLDWSDDVLDIREQYPLLDLDSAVAIAAQIGVKYPADKISGFPYVLTTDFMVTTRQGLKARTIKMSAELNKKRVLEKLEIEKRYWDIHGIDWKIVTENEISYIKAKNIEWLYSAQDFNATNESTEIIRATETMLNMFETSEQSVKTIAKIVEEKFLLAEGTGLHLFKYLTLNRKISFDLNETLDLNNTKKVWVIK